jgi:hypothetical protein
MMRSASCGRYRRALATLAEPSAASVPTSEGQAALEHVVRCSACATSLGELMLTATALRRIGAEAAALSDPGVDDASRRLRARLERTSAASRDQAWRGRASFNGLALSMLMVVVLVGPAALRFGADAASGPSSDQTTLTRILSVDAGIGTDGWNPPGPVVPSGPGQVVRIDRDGSRPVQKEVSSTSSTLRPKPR